MRMFVEDNDSGKVVVAVAVVLLEVDAANEVSL